MPGTVRVLIVDDAPRTVDNLKKLLAFESDIEVVGTAANAAGGIQAAHHLEPDMVLMDVNLPDMDGIRATRQLGAELPLLPVVMISVQEDREYLRQAMQAGAREYLVKPFSADELIAAIRRVSNQEKRRRRHGTLPPGAVSAAEVLGEPVGQNPPGDGAKAAAPALPDLAAAIPPDLAASLPPKPGTGRIKVPAASWVPAAVPAEAAVEAAPPPATPAAPPAAPPAPAPPPAAPAAPPEPRPAASVPPPAAQAPLEAKTGIRVPSTTSWEPVRRPSERSAPPAEAARPAEPAASSEPGLPPVEAVAQTWVPQPRSRPSAAGPAAPASAPAPPVAVPETEPEPELALPPIPPPLEKRSGSGQVIAVYSGRGGSGKSILAVNLAAVIAREGGEDVALVDLDLQFGDAALLVGIEPAGSLADLVQSQATLDYPTVGAIMPLAPTGFRVLPAPIHPELADLVTAAHVKAVIELLRTAFDTIILDLSSHLGEVTLEALANADRVVLLTDLQLPSLKQARLAYQLFEGLNISRNKVLLVLNRDEQVGKIGPAAAAAGLEARFAVRIPTEEKPMVQSVEKAVPLVESFPDTDVARKVRELAALLVPLAGPAATVTSTRAPRRRLFGRTG